MASPARRALIAGALALLAGCSDPAPEPCARWVSAGRLVNECECNLLRCERFGPDTTEAGCWCDPHAKESGAAWVDLAKQEADCDGEP